MVDARCVGTLFRGFEQLLIGRAPKMRVDPDLWEVLSNPGAAYALTPAQVHFALLPEELGKLARKLTVEIREGEIRLAF